MNPLELLTQYLGKVERRLRWFTVTRGAALIAGAALVATVLLVFIANRYAFSDGSLIVSRAALFTSLALALGLGLVLPLLRLNARRAAREAEQKSPQFEERLLTFVERADSDPRDPFLHLLAADTMKAAQDAAPARVAANRSLAGLGSLAAIAVVTLVWLGTSGPGFWGYGTSLLWAGPPKAEAVPFYDIVVDPGNKTIRKRSDLLVTARPNGFTPQRVRLFARFASAAKWDEVAMQPQPSSPAFQFLFSGVAESLDYYVEAGNVRTKTFKLSVIDLPSVKRIRVTYKFPSWTGMQPETEDPGGDLRAVEGTEAELAIETDKPLQNGVIVTDDGNRIPIENGKAKVPILKEGQYHIAALERGEQVRLTDDYFIDAKRDNPPTVRIRRPGRDARVNPVEEVPVVVEADDDFGLQELKLLYSVNGGEEKTVSMLPGKGLKVADGKHLIALEDYKMSPGDIVSLRAQAKDARKVVNTDIFFIEAQPFEREYSQSQQAGGGGGGGGEEPNRISQRQKEIIAATWNQIKDSKPDKASGIENGKFLSDVQAKLRDQAKSLANRMKSRALAGTNQEFKSFVEDMEKAVEAMGPAADKLKAQAWQGALSPEQKALQHLLRAEATFRQIQVAFGSRGGGGGGGGQSGRDLENLFDLELDTEKNQYESGGTQASGDQREKEIDEALQKLEQLARRQQELADQQRKNPQAFQQRWQQEMLRREAEKLQRQMEQLSRNGAQSQQQSQSSQSGQQGQQGQPGQQGQSGQSGQQSQQQQQQQQQQQRLNSMSGRGGQQQLDQALERLKQATKDMQSATSDQANGSGQSEAEARRAAERLKEARDILSGMRKQQAGDQVSNLARQSERIADKQRDFATRMMKEFGAQSQGQGGGTVTRQRAEELAGEKLGLQKELQQLEKEMAAAARDLAGTDRSTSGKLRQALSDVQQDEVARAMGLSAEALRRGLGSLTVMREAGQAQALGNLRDRLQEIERGLGKGKPGEKGLEQALQQAEALRKQMQQMARQMGRGDQQGQQPGQRGQQGQQPGQGQQGQQGKGQQGQGQQGQGQQGQGQQGQGQQGQGQQGQGQGQGGQQQGQGQGQGQGQNQNGQQGGQRGDGAQSGRNNGSNFGQGGSRDGGPFSGPDGYRAMNDGSRGFEGGRGGPGNIESVERMYREGLRDLTSLRENVREDPDIEREVRELIRNMQRLDPKRFPGNPALVERLHTELLGAVEQIELQIRRKLDDQQGGSVRSGDAERVPPGYANSVAEYFKKLSK
ncbi:MAG: hypothetical protein ACRD8O_05755 [Bryobacteraceae bacterium]